MRKITLQEASDRLGNIVMDAKRSHEPTVITQYGQSEAVIIDFREWQRLSALGEKTTLAAVPD